MLTHRIRLDGPGVRGTTVNACLLRDVLNLVIDGSQRAVRLRTQGRSTAPGTKPGWIEAASEFSVRILEGSTVLEVEAPSLLEADPDEFSQENLFPEIDPTRTSIQYFTESLSAAIEGESAARSNLYDKSFLELLRDFDSVLHRGVTYVEIDSNGAAQLSGPVRVTREAIPRFGELVSRIPDPQHVRLAGKLDQIRDSDCSLVLQLPENEETVKGIATSAHMEDLRRLWRQAVLVSGQAHFNVAGGVQRIDVEHIAQASEEDLGLWAQPPRPLFHATRPAEFRVSQGPRSGINAIIGKWPGDESDEEIALALEQLS
ncbi:MAG: hypothetical protein KAY24_18135 [Candidatus Eisenbacteria sp.]|nr:hypothetical protein [Candidatus Eisenbacteria bacterium]